MDVRFSIIGHNRVKNSLRALASAYEKELRPTIHKWGQGVRRKLKSKPYPARRPGQKYVRTGRLASSWAFRARGKGWTFENRAQGESGAYASFVVGDEQAWMHKGRWWMASDVIKEELPDLRGRIATRIFQLLAKAKGR